MPDGQWDDLVDAETDQVLRGALTVGAVVRPGVTLRVEGVMGGGCKVEKGGRLVVWGVWSCSVQGNDGEIWLSGVITHLPASRQGRIFVAAGSLVTVGGTFTVDRTGRKNHLGPGQHSPPRPSTTEYVGYLGSGIFQPVDMTGLQLP